jgi:hypothetical protein
MTADLFVSFSLAVDEADSDSPIPTNLILEQNYPNPFNSVTRIDYNLERPGSVRIEIFNVLGQRALDIICESVPPGSHSFTWNGRDERGKEMPSGVHFYRVTSGGQSRVKTMMFLK